MLSFWIIEELDVIKHILPSQLAGGIGSPPDPFLFEKLEKALSNSIIITVTPPAHTGFQIVGLKELLPLIAGKLAALVRVNDYL